MPSTSGNALVLVIDLNLSWWGETVGKPDQPQIAQSLDAIIVFCNTFIMLDSRNQVAIIAVYGRRSSYLFHSKQQKILQTQQQTIEGQPQPRRQPDGQYDLFADIEKAIVRGIKDLVDGLSEAMSDTVLAGAVSKGLCYLNRLTKELDVGKLLPGRILVVAAAADNQAQHMNFMNTVFTAQKHEIIIDSCVLGKTSSSLLQQATDLTGGVYVEVTQPHGLLQYLLWAFLPDALSRKKLNMPSKSRVDYRAACFCHRKLVQIGRWFLISN